MAKSKNFIKSKNQNYSSNLKNIGIKSDFFTPKPKLEFTKLKQVFDEALIFYYLNLDYYILMKPNASCYIISRILI